jgi:hypothetical protein
VGELAEQSGRVAGRQEIELAADRPARIAVINQWLDEHGVFGDKRSGRPREILRVRPGVSACFEFVERASARATIFTSCSLLSNGTPCANAY